MILFYETYGYVVLGNFCVSESCDLINLWLMILLTSGIDILILCIKLLKSSNTKTGGSLSCWWKDAAS